jgi:anaerobic selenocysteine-containing dehydrogenase
VAGGLIRVDMQAIVERGGRVVVVDPRRTETAERFEHIAVRPDGDAWLLLSLLHVIFAEGLADEAATRAATGVQDLRVTTESFAPESVAMHSGVPADVVRSLARHLAAAPSAAVYGRVGACLGSHATLVNFLLDALNVVTGNLDRAGGSVFPSPPIDFWATLKKQGSDTYATKHTRVGNYPEVGGIMPAGVMAAEMTTPGPGQVRAFFVTAGNPVLSVPNPPALRQALEQLDLMVSIDFYDCESSARRRFRIRPNVHSIAETWSQVWV